jgi:hypothetical protein
VVYWNTLVGAKGHHTVNERQVGIQLRALRAGLGVGPRELARRTGVPHPVICDLEHGNGKRSLGLYARRLAAALGPQVMGFVAPGQLTLTLDWEQATRRADLDMAARRWLRGRARQDLLAGFEQAEVWRLPGAVLLIGVTPATVSGDK